MQQTLHARCADYWFNFFYSQIFFTVSEAFVFCCAIALVDKTTQVPQPVWYAAAGTSAYHILQLVLDEGHNMLGRGGWHRLGRDTHMVLGDSIHLVALVMAGRQMFPGRKSRDVLLRIAIVAACEWVVFHTCFADAASGGGGISSN